MNCIICKNDKWENIDQYRYKPQGMSMCTVCGFCSYPSKWKTKADIIAYYRKDYRPPARFQNFSTNNRKCHFHALFLDDVFKEWKYKNVKPKIFEVGAAYGMALNFLRTVTGGKVSGSELNLPDRRLAMHEFGIELKEEFDDEKYDMIMSYKVAEHMLDVDVEIQRYAKSLNPGGYLYISVPTWFDSMNNFGLPGFDLEYYYDPNHINVWTQKHFETMLWNNGFKIIKKDLKTYDATYMCQVHDGTVMKKSEYENPEEIKFKLDRIKQAFEKFKQNKFDDAISLYPDYPQAHVSRFEMSRKQNWKQFQDKGWDWVKEHIIDFGYKHCPNAVEMDVLAADICMRFGKPEDAIKYCEKGLAVKPANPIFLNMMINIMREMAVRANTNESKAHYFKQAIEIAEYLIKVSPEHLAIGTDMKYLFKANIPIAGENV